MVNTSAAHIGDCSMPEIMEMKPLDSSAEARGMERRFNGTKRLTLDQKYMVFISDNAQSDTDGPLILNYTICTFAGASTIGIFSQLIIYTSHM